MSAPRLTDWIPGDQKPVRVGIYNTRSEWGGKPNEGAYQYWDGKQFRCTNSTPSSAYADRDYPTDYLNPEWRGLASDPSKATPP